MKNILYFITIALLCFQCNNSSDQKTKINNLIKKTILNKKVDSITNILNEDKNYSNIILLFSQFDCNICIKKSFEALSIFQSNRYPNKLFVIGLDKNYWDIQLKYNYHGKIYLDENQSILSELKFVPTPIFLLINADNKVVRCLPVFPTTSTMEIKDFINSFLN